MAVLKYKRRKSLPASDFALPKERKYPIQAPAQQRNALARAAQQKKAGNLSDSEYKEVVSKARAKLYKGRPKAKARSKATMGDKPSWQRSISKSVKGR